MDAALVPLTASPHGRPHPEEPRRLVLRDALRAPQDEATGRLEGRRLDAAAKDFEAVFIAETLAPLFSSVSTPEIAGGGKSEEFFQSLLAESYAKAMAERGGFGLADHVKASLIHLQGARDAAPTPLELKK